MIGSWRGTAVDIGRKDVGASQQLEVFRFWWIYAVMIRMMRNNIFIETSFNTQCPKDDQNQHWFRNLVTFYMSISCLYFNIFYVL